mmetsp:Transcript_42434/g.62982  ORF Transcript_42434/g.62982 Transcript_42434/m.62982 type:complete len:140 (-) Transcript_42434:157-576(-)
MRYCTFEVAGSMIGEASSMGQSDHLNRARVGRFRSFVCFRSLHSESVDASTKQVIQQPAGTQKLQSRCATQAPTKASHVTLSIPRSKIILLIFFRPGAINDFTVESKRQRSWRTLGSCATGSRATFISLRTSCSVGSFA